LIFLVLGIGVALGWVVHRAQVQREAVATISKAGGSIRYDWQHQDGRTIRGGKPRGPKWLADRLGADYFDAITVVLGGGAISDAELAPIGQLTRLELLKLRGATAVTDAGLENLTGMTLLQNLNLMGTPVTDAGLMYLQGRSSLRFLNLRFTPVTDAGLAHLKGLPGMTTLWLADTRVTDAGLAYLKGLSGLERLNLTGTAVTDAGVRELGKVRPNLRISH